MLFRIPTWPKHCDLGVRLATAAVLPVFVLLRCNELSLDSWTNAWESPREINRDTFTGGVASEN